MTHNNANSEANSSLPESNSVQTDNRSLPRFPCQIVVSERSRSAPLGELVDLSLDGARLITSDVWAEGAVLPLVFQLSPKIPELNVEAEIVRKTADGVGLRFLSLSRQDARRLRRFISDLNAIVSHRDAISRLHQVDASTSVPITEPTQITALLENGKDQELVSIIPAVRSVKEHATIIAVHPNELVLQTKQNCKLQENEEVFCIYALDYLTYSFQATVQKVTDTSVTLSFPEVMYYSERRSHGRNAALANSFIELKLPWRNNELVSWPIRDISDGGLSFITQQDEVAFWPGTTLPSCVLRIDQQETPLDNVTVRRINSHIDEASQQPITVVGVSFGIERSQLGERQAKLLSEEQDSGWHRVSKWSRNLLAATTYFYHTRLRRRAQAVSENTSKLVRFNNKSNKYVVGLLDASFPLAEKTRAPLVIVAPGFGGRKETLSALAQTIIHNFRRNNQDVAVLRFDGTNNLGESYKDPGCEKEGHHTMNYTISGAIDDFIGSLEWARNNKYIDPSDISVVSVSFSSIAVRRALTMQEASNITQWISFMGAADAQNAVMNVSGNIDGYGNYLRGIKNGTITLIGCMTNGDHFCEDMHQLNIATLDDARRDMANIRSDISWFIGKQDSFMDERRVKDVMSVKAPGKREIVSVNAGHVPTSSDEALAQFALIAQQVWRHHKRTDIKAVIPSRGWLAAVNDAEWKRVRSESPLQHQDYWRTYLLGEDNGIGFDLISLTEEYRQLVEDQVGLLDPHGKVVLDIGAGTGNVSMGIAKCQPKSLTCLDLVPEALERLKHKIDPNLAIQTVAQSIDGSAKTAMSRWLQGDMASFSQLAARLPGVSSTNVEAIVSRYNEQLHAYLRGAQLPIDDIIRKSNMPEQAVATLKQIHTLARLVQNRISEAQAEAIIGDVLMQNVRGRPGLPFANNAFEGIMASLVLSYMEFPNDTLAEIFRILKPGAPLVISSMLPDADTSKPYMDSIAFLEKAPEDQLPFGKPREELLHDARAFMNKASGLMRLEEEGVFKFWTGEELSELLLQAGFENCSVKNSFGQKPQATIVYCVKPA